MSTLPPTNPVIAAVDLTEKPKELHEEGYVPRSVNGKAVHLGSASAAKPVEPSKARFQLTPFRDIAITEGVAYLVKDLLPTPGLVVVWGPPKCGKSFWMFDLSMHIALGREYRGRRVQQGPVVYLALEGDRGFTYRVEAFRRRHSVKDAPFYLITDHTDLVADHKQLTDAIKAQSSERPVLVVIDTLNRSLAGSENSDKDMAAYIRVADVIREAFECTVAIIHHCGVSGDRPRGHTSLTGAVDAQLAVKRDRDTGVITVKVEWLKDGQEGAEIASLLEQVKLGADGYGDPIESCVVVADEPGTRLMVALSSQIVRPAVAKLKPKAKLALEQLHECIAEAGQEAPISNNIPPGTTGVMVKEWRDRLGKAGVINVDGNPRQQFIRIREDLQSAKLIAVWEDFVWLT
jgi:AAA domain-containing protein